METSWEVQHMWHWLRAQWCVCVWQSWSTHALHVFRKSEHTATSTWQFRSWVTLSHIRRYMFTNIARLARHTWIHVNVRTWVESALAMPSVGEKLIAANIQKKKEKLVLKFWDQTTTFWQHVCIRSQSHRTDLAVKTVFQTPLCSSLHWPHVVPMLQLDHIQRQQYSLLRTKANMILGNTVRQRCRKSSDSTSAIASHIYRVNTAI